VQRNDLVAAQGKLGVGFAALVAEFDLISIWPEQLDDSPNLASPQFSLWKNP
jgi:hypothetical protein